MEKFYLVANDSRNELAGDEYLARPPKYIHDRRGDAETEALRLAKRYGHRGERFVVLEAVAYTAPLPIAGEYKLIDVPKEQER